MDSFNIGLVFPPGWDSVTPPLGISYIKSFLSSNGFNVSCIDFSPKLGGRFFNGSEKSLNECANKILNSEPDIVGFTSLYSNLEYILRMSQAIKNENPRVKIVVGGPHSSYIRDELFEVETPFDFSISGEGELPFLEILHKLQSGEKNNGKVFGPKWATNLDTLPCPNFVDYNIEEYPIPMLPITMTRGCNNSCTFCGIIGNPVTGPYRERNPKGVIDEIEGNIKDYDVTNFLFTDALLNSNEELIGELCDLIIKSNLDIKWAAEVHPNINEKIVDKMYKAGCRFLWISPETGSKKTMDRMKKGVDIESSKDSIRMAHDKGIFVSTWLIVGFPGETESDVEDTISYAEDVKEHSDELLFVPFSLMKGSHIFDNPQEYGVTDIGREPCDIWCSYKTREGINELEAVKITLQLWEDYNNLDLAYPFLEDYPQEEIQEFIGSLPADEKRKIQDYIQKTKDKKPYTYQKIFKKIFK